MPFIPPQTYADFMTRRDEVEELLDFCVKPCTEMAVAHFGALAHDLDELLDGAGIHTVEDANFVERFVDVWQRFRFE